MVHGPVQLFARSTGEGPAVVMLPPAATSGDIWHTHQVPALTRVGYRVVTANLRGMEPSPTPPGPYRIDDMAEDVAGLIEAENLDPCHIVGSSLGAMVAQELVVARPDLVRSVSLLGTRAATATPQRTWSRSAAAQTRERTTVTEQAARAQLETMFGPRSLSDPRFVADWLGLLRAFPVTGPGPAAQYEASVVTDRLPALRQVTQPCLVIAFGADVVTPPADCRAVHEVLPASRLVSLPDLGHFGYLEDPEAVNDTLLTFLAQAETSRSDPAPAHRRPSS